MHSLQTQTILLVKNIILLCCQSKCKPFCAWRTYHPPSQRTLYTFKKIPLCEKKMGNLRNELLQMFWNCKELTWAFTEKTVSNVPFLIDWNSCLPVFLKLRTHLVDKRPSYLFERSILKFRISFCEVATKNICEFLKLGKLYTFAKNFRKL